MNTLLIQTFGWFWLTLGMLTGVFLGLGFSRENWLGGYASWPRRLLRLGHIAMTVLGLLCVVFAQSLPRLALASPWPALASALWIAGAILMPLACLIAAFFPRTVPLFALPVISLIGAGTITWAGLAVAALRPH